jgi:hypothetical protein
LAAKGKIGLHGPVEFQNLSEYAIGSKANAILISRYSEKNMLIGVGINNATTFNALTDRMNSVITLSDLRTSASSLFLAAHNIYVDGNILPINTSLEFNIGSYTRYFNKGVFNYIEVGDFGSTEKGLWIGKLPSGNLTDYGIIKEGNGLTYTVQIGQEADPINYGYFDNLSANNLTINTSINVPEVIINGDSAGVWDNVTTEFNANKYNFARTDTVDFKKVLYTIIGDTLILDISVEYTLNSSIQTSVSKVFFVDTIPNIFNSFNSFQYTNIKKELKMFTINSYEWEISTKKYRLISNDIGLLLYADNSITDRLYFDFYRSLYDIMEQDFGTDLEWDTEFKNNPIASGVTFTFQGQCIFQIVKT